MTDNKRDELIVEMHTDIKWIKEWIKIQNRYKFMVWSALIAAVIGIIL